jgi:hypothetical protein
MNRREFLAVAGGSFVMSMPAGAAEGKPAIIELRRVQLRNTPDAMSRRTQDFLEKAYVPALKRSGATVVGAFNSVIGMESPYILLVSEFPDVGAWEAAGAKVQSDQSTAKMRDEYYGGPLQYVREEVTLLRGFPGFPRVQVPPARDGGRSRIFEVRRYESNNPRSLARKIRMFDEGEHALFAKLGMVNVFFGETIAGADMQNLTYMVGFDDLAHREKAWGAFGSSPEWKKMSSQPGVSDAEIVSNISNSIVRPLGFSAIR